MYLSGLLSNADFSDLSQTLISWPLYSNTNGWPMSPSVMPQTRQVLSGYGFGRIGFAFLGKDGERQQQQDAGEDDFIFHGRDLICDDLLESRLFQNMKLRLTLNSAEATSWLPVIF